MDVPCSALGDNIGVSIAVFFAFVVLLGVANGLVRNGEISDTGAVNAILPHPVKIPSTSTAANTNAIYFFILLYCLTDY